MKLFVTVGNAPGRFDRLLRLVDEVLADAAFQDVTGTCQYGTALVRPRSLRCVPVLSRTEFEDELRRADAVVTHAGVGSLSAAIRAGHRPIVMPRRFAHAEHVNDHQLEIARELAARGLITVIEDATSLRAALRSARRSLPSNGGGHGGFPALERAFVPTKRKPAMAAQLLVRLLAMAAPPLDRLRIR